MPCHYSWIFEKQFNKCSFRRSALVWYGILRVFLFPWLKFMVIIFACWYVKENSLKILKRLFRIKVIMRTRKTHWLYCWRKLTESPLLASWDFWLTPLHMLSMLWDIGWLLRSTNPASEDRNVIFTGSEYLKENALHND